MNLLEEIVIQAYKDAASEDLRNVPKIEQINSALMGKNGIEVAKSDECLDELRVVLNKLNLTYDESGEIKNPIIREVW
ncbi:hypothetical protein [Bacillus paranthracis]|uniref:hypothetical protein n=1 Tax=Bacillus paranthracis TaxID=2026186 RepID=UPI0002D45432